MWSTLLGGGDNDYAHGLAVDAAGFPVVAGYTRSWNFPATPGAYDETLNGSYDAFVARFDPTGSDLLWATFIGGSQEDRALGVLLDDEGNSVVAGPTYSTDFPTTPGAFAAVPAGQRDGYVLKLDSTGAVLIWSTYLGGCSSDWVWDLVLDDQDRPMVVGETYSSDFPVTDGAFDTVANGGADAFVTKLESDGSALSWSTFLGGSAADQLTQVVLDPQQRVVACGNSRSSNYPTTAGAFNETHNGRQDCIVSVLDPSGSTLLMSTFLGGAEDDMGNVVAVDGAGGIVVTGSTLSVDFPVTAGAYDTSHNGGKDIFLTRLAPDGSVAVWSTFLGGSGVDEPFALVLNGSGCPILSGEITSPDFPTTPDAFDPDYSGEGDAFLTVLDPMGRSLIWSSYIGGSLSDSGWELFLDPVENPVLAGPTRSPDFPTTFGAYDRSHNGAKDVFLLAIDLRAIMAAGEMSGPRSVVTAAPNPFRRAIELRSDLLASARGEVDVLDALGRIVASLDRGIVRSGPASFVWDGRDRSGRRLPPGVYWFRAETERSILTRKILHLR